MIRFFCAGDTRAKIAPCSATWPSAASSNRLDVVAGDDLLLAESNAPADVPGHDGIVPGEDLHADAVAAQFLEHLGDVVQDGIREADEASQDQMRLVVS